MGYRIVYGDEIAHGHKYYTKIDQGTKNGKKTSRYFYSLAEYQAYLRDKRKGIEDSVKNRFKKTEQPSSYRVKSNDNASGSNKGVGKLKYTGTADTYSEDGTKHKSAFFKDERSGMVRFKHVEPRNGETEEKAFKRAEKEANKDQRKADAISRTLKTANKLLSTKPGQMAYNVVRKVTDKAKSDMDKSKEMRVTYDKPIGPENKMAKENAKPKEETKPKAETKPKEETKPAEETKEEVKDTRSTYEKFVDNLMNKLGIKKKDKQDKPTDDLKNINPDFDPNNYGTSNNCAWCTAAFDLSRRGYDVEAKSITPDVMNTEEVICDWYKGEKLRDMNDGAADYINEHVDDKRTQQIYNNLLNMGFSAADANTGTMANLVAEKVKQDILADAKGSDESWGHTIVYWRGTEGKSDAGGHDIAYYTKGNDVHFYDCQNGQEYELADVIFASGMIWTNTKTNETITYNDQIKFFRSDNCELETGATDGVQPRRKKGNK